MIIYLDDVRETPEGYHRCFKIEEVQEFLKAGLVQYLSLDHDLGDSYPLDQVGCPTGYDLCKWMAEQDLWPHEKPGVHSANPVGVRNMLAVIERYWHPPGTPKKF